MASSIKAKDIEETPFFSETQDVSYYVAYTNKKGKVMFYEGKKTIKSEKTSGQIGAASEYYASFSALPTPEGKFENKKHAQIFIDETETDVELYIVKVSENVVISKEI